MSTHTGHPDVDEAVAYLDTAMRAITLAKAALRGEGSPTLFVTSEPYATPYTAKTTAEVAEGVPGWDDPLPPDHEDVRRFIGALCPAKWGDPGDPMRCSLTSGHAGNHATTERIEWGGAWQTAEAAAGGWTSGSCSTPGGDAA